jgi:DegV family protein with EDD domain
MAGLSPEDAARYDIPVIPQVIHFGQESYLECEEMDVPAFIERLLASSVLPKTSAPPPELYHPHLQRFATDGEPILCIHPSSKVSGTVRSATVARQAFPDVDIRVMDTLALGAPLGQMVLMAAQLAAEGESAESIWGRLETLIPRVRTYFTVDTLEYLQRGGRIGAAKSLLGNLLRIRPVLAWREGEVQPAVSERTTKRALERLVRLACEEAPRDRDPMFSVMHAASPLAAEEIADRLRDEFCAVAGSKELDVWVTDLVPAIITHAGPGAVAIGFFA